MRIRSAAYLLLVVWLRAAQSLWAVDETNWLRFIAVADHADGIYKPGETIHWVVRGTNGSVENLLKCNYTVRRGGLSLMREGDLKFTAGVAEVAITNAGPGTVLLEVKGQDQDRKKAKGYGGAIVSPKTIKPSLPPPADFKPFWKEKIKELSRVSVDPQVTAGVSGRTNVEYWQISLGNIRGTRVRGQIARRKTGEKFPAMLIVQGAGVYGLKSDWVTHPASKGWLAMNISAHDLPIDKPAAFYEEQTQGSFKEYWKRGNDDREKSYFLRMYLACYRAAEYLTERPDWDGKTFLVIGTSQGGLQALLTAAFQPKVTAVIAGVPGGCDLTREKAGGRNGWPAWTFRTAGEEAIQTTEASRYYDLANFTSRIKCPALVSAGLIDEVCPPEGIVAAVNQIKGPTELILMPRGDHMGTDGSHQRFAAKSKAWQAALLEGRAVPVMGKSE